jgi:hypothetical protein
MTAKMENMEMGLMPAGGPLERTAAEPASVPDFQG